MSNNACNQTHYQCECGKAIDLIPGPRGRDGAEGPNGAMGIMGRQGHPGPPGAAAPLPPPPVCFHIPVEEDSDHACPQVFESDTCVTSRSAFRFQVQLETIIDSNRRDWKPTRSVDIRIMPIQQPTDLRSLVCTMANVPAIFQVYINDQQLKLWYPFESEFRQLLYDPSKPTTTHDALLLSLVWHDASNKLQLYIRRPSTITTQRLIQQCVPEWTSYAIGSSSVQYFVSFKSTSFILHATSSSVHTNNITTNTAAAVQGLDTFPQELRITHQNVIYTLNWEAVQQSEFLQGVVDVCRSSVISIDQLNLDPTAVEAVLHSMQNNTSDCISPEMFTQKIAFGHLSMAINALGVKHLQQRLIQMLVEYTRANLRTTQQIAAHLWSWMS